MKKGGHRSFMLLLYLRIKWFITTGLTGTHTWVCMDKLISSVSPLGRLRAPQGRLLNEGGNYVATFGPKKC